jgi:antisense regulator of RalR protein
MYKITATILKPGGLPVEWTCMSKDKLTSTQCEKKFSQVKEAGKTAEERVLVKNFKCVSLPHKRKVTANGK